MKTVFVHVPKTAGGSVIKWFESNNLSLCHGHKRLSNFERNYDFSFSIIRNTFHRLVSAYVFHLERLPGKIEKKKQKRDLAKIEELEKNLYFARKGIISWLEFSIDNQQNVTWDLITWTKGVDYIIRQDCLNKDFEKIQHKFKKYSSLQPTRQQNYSINDFLSKDYISFIEKHYTKEIEIFNFAPV